MLRLAVGSRLQELMRLFHHRLMNHLGVVKPEVEDTWDYEGAIKVLQEAAAAGLQHLASIPNGTSNTLTSATTAASSPSGLKSTISTDQTSNSEQLQSELTDLLSIPTLLLPEGVGDPESGASGPPPAVKAIWDLVSGSNGSRKDGSGDETSRQLALGGPEDAPQHGRKCQ